MEASPWRPYTHFIRTPHDLFYVEQVFYRIKDVDVSNKGITTNRKLEYSKLFHSSMIAKLQSYILFISSLLVFVAGQPDFLYVLVS